MLTRRKALARIVPELQRDVVTYDKAVQASGFAHHSDLGFDFDHDSDEVERVGERTIASTGEIKPVYAFKELPYYGRALQRHVAFAKDKPRNDEERYGKIANPTVHIGLNQVRVVVNALIRRYGRPAEVVVELARDLKQSREQSRRRKRSRPTTSAAMPASANALPRPWASAPSACAPATSRNGSCGKS